MNLSSSPLFARRPRVGTTLLLLFLLILFGAALLARAQSHPPATADAGTPEVAYLKQVNQWRPPTDPQLHFLLMGQFAQSPFMLGVLVWIQMI